MYKFAIGFVVVALIALCIWVEMADEKQWEQYAQQHHCVKVGTKKGTTQVGLSLDGKGTMVTTITPDQSIYSCDAGEIQIR